MERVNGAGLSFWASTPTWLQPGSGEGDERQSWRQARRPQGSPSSPDFIHL